MAPMVNININFNPNNGSVNVGTNAEILVNKVLMYGVLEAAKDAVRDFKPETAASGIVLASGELPGRMPRGL